MKIPKHLIRKIPYNPTAEIASRLEVMAKTPLAKKKQLLLDARRGMKNTGPKGPTSGVKRFFSESEIFNIGSILYHKKLYEMSPGVVRGIRKGVSEFYKGVPAETKKRIGVPVLAFAGGAAVGTAAGKSKLRKKQRKEIEQRLKMARAYRDQVINNKLGVGHLPTKDLGYTK